MRSTIIAYDSTGADSIGGVITIEICLTEYMATALRLTVTDDGSHTVPQTATVLLPLDAMRALRDRLAEAIDAASAKH